MHTYIQQEKEIFDAHSELVKVGTDSPRNIALSCTSVDSLDLIQPLWKYDDEHDTDAEVSDNEWVNQEACSDILCDKGSKLSHASEVTECCICLEDNFTLRLYDNYKINCNKINVCTFSVYRCANHRDKDYHQQTPEHYNRTTFRQTILTDVTIDGYVYTELLNHTSTSY